MSPLRSTVLAAAALISVSVANAQTAFDGPRVTFDMATVTCKQFVGMPTGQSVSLIYWLDGNYRGDDNTIIDTDQQKKMFLQLVEYCKANSTHGLITAAEKLFAKRK